MNIHRLIRLRPVWGGLAALGFAGVLTVAGCHSSSPSPVASAPAPVLSLPPSDAAASGQVASKFLAALSRRDAQGAEAWMAPAFRASMPPTALQKLLSGRDRAFLGASRFQFDPPPSLAHGTRTVYRTRFPRPGGGDYRANLLLVKSGPVWQVSGLLPPVAPQKRFSNQGGSQKEK